MLDLATEAQTWKPIPGHPGYEVSDLGNVRSLVGRAPRVLRPGLESGGYRMVVLRGKAVKCARAVLLAFSGPRPADGQSRHLNGIRTDDRLCNLAWGTRSENEKDKRGHGTAPIGENHGSAVLTEAIVLEIRALYPAVRVADIAERFGIHIRTAYAVIRRERWAHVGAPS